jgi:uncharacterized repeat protein (TIGR01451 family)
MLSVALIAVGVLVLPGSADNNKGDTWLTDSPAVITGHAHEPHLECGTIYMHGSALDPSGTYEISSIPGTGHDVVVVTGTWTTPVTGDVITTFSGSAVVAAAIALDGAVANPQQGYHFKLTLSQDGVKHKTFWVKCDETPAAPTLGVTKTADASPVVSGNDIGFTVTVGTGSFANDATLNDPLPAGAGIDWSISPAYTGPGTCTINGTAPTQTLVCHSLDLGVAPLVASISVHLSSHTVAGTTAALASDTVTNTATASADDVDPMESTAHIVVTPAPVVVPLLPSLGITKTADAASVTAGSLVGFTVAVHNSGPGSAVNATLSDPLPSLSGASWAIDPTYSGPGSCAITGSAPSQTLGCSFGTMASGDSASVHVTGTSPATAVTLTNLATASADNNTPVTATAHTTTTVPNQAPTLTPKLAISKVADAATVNAGSQVGFTVSVANQGPGVANNVSVNDHLPATGAGIWTMSPANASCAINGTSQPQTLACSFGNMASGATASVHVVASTPVGTAITLLNVATTVADNNPPVSANAQVKVDVPAAAAVLGLNLSTSPSPTPSPSTSVLGLSLTKPATGSLPRTGGVPINLVYPALFLLLAGGGLLVAGRNRKVASAASSSGNIAPWAVQAKKSRRDH